jgi:hypothetical protein
VFVFYAGWKIVGFHAGIAAATALAVVAYLWERRQARSGLSPAIGLGIAVVQAVAGLMSARTLWYFAPSLIVNAACGVAFVVSVAVGQPLAAAFAAETSAFPSDVMASGLFRSVCSQISLVWAGYSGAASPALSSCCAGVDSPSTSPTAFPAAAIMGMVHVAGARCLRGASRSLT